jgi:hypothetical protein
MVQCSLQTRFSSCVVALPNFMRGTAASRNPYPARRNPQRATNFGKVPIAQKQLNCSNTYSQTSMHRHRRHHRRSRHYMRVIAIVVRISPAPPSWKPECREIKSDEEITSEKDTVVSIKTPEANAMIKAIKATAIPAIKKSRSGNPRVPLNPGRKPRPLRPVKDERKP